MNDPMSDRTILKLLLRFAAAGAAFYGAWIMWFHSFNGPNAFSAWNSVPEVALGLPLILGAAAYAVGERRNWPILSFFGLLAPVAVFGMADYSCLTNTLPSTGVPAYTIVGGFFLILAVGVAARNPSSGSSA